MTKIIAILALSLMTSCATMASPAADEAAILSDARSRSASFCATIKEGCEFSLSKEDDGWSIWVKPIFHADDGTRVSPFDIDDMYFYDRRGRYKSSLRGY